MSSGAGDRILRALAQAVEGGDPVVLATIVETTGSVPRHAGTKMVVGRDGATVGTVGGGAVESTIIDEALALMRGRRSDLRTYTLRGPSEGEHGVCGGTMSVYLEPYMAPSTIYIIGAGHVGRAVSDLAHWVGYRTVVVDDRAELMDEASLPNADVRFTGTAEEALVTHPPAPADAIVVVTRSHEVDARITPALLATDAGYIGVMGSKRRWALTRQALGDEGLSGEALDRIHNPIGLDIGAETVEEIAVSILSEVIAAHTGKGD